MPECVEEKDQSFPCQLLCFRESISKRYTPELTCCLPCCICTGHNIIFSCFCCCEHRKHIVGQFKVWKLVVLAGIMMKRLKWQKQALIKCLLYELWGLAEQRNKLQHKKTPNFLKKGQGNSTLVITSEVTPKQTLAAVFIWTELGWPYALDNKNNITTYQAGLQDWNCHQ